MKKIVSIFLAAVLTFSFSLTAFAVTGTEANAARDEAKATFDNLANEKFDIDGSEQITAADARLTLLYSAGLRNDETERAADADVDGDGKVTALDARTILRISSKLENAASYYTDEEKLAYFNAIINTARPNNYYLYKNGIEYTANVTYTDPKGVVSALDNAFKLFDSSVDFSSGLTSNKGEKIYNSNTFYGSTSSAKNKMMFISNSDGVEEYQSSYLTVDDITGVEYKTNQSYTFTRYGTTRNSNNTTVIDTSNLMYSETVTGLDSLTVSLKKDNDIMGTHASKAFTVYEKEALEKEIKDVAESFNSMSTDLSILGNMQFDVKPSLGNVNYHDAQITVYFYPETGNIISAYYSIYTDYTMGLYMDVDIDFLLVDKAGQVNITNTTQSIMEYYFIKNYPNHVDW